MRESHSVVLPPGAPERRVGEIFLRRDVTLIRHWIETDRLALYASDALPVGAEIEVDVES